MEYQKYFDIMENSPQKQVPWPKVEEPQAGDGEEGTGTIVQAGDRRDGLVYVYKEKVELAVNVALATGRPMLVRGPSGGGKSSLARNVARRMKWRYYERVITSRTQAQDLLWTFDALRRLSDAQAKQLRKKAAYYVEPGVLWWAFDPASAERRGLPEGQEAGMPPDDPGVGPKGSGAVVLLDEIDKADPDVPNNMLIPVGSYEFTVRETNTPVRARRPLLLIITTNDERVLPVAFMRRCVVLELDPPDEDDLVNIAVEHYGPDMKGIYRPIAKRVVALAYEGASPPAKGAPRKDGAAPAGPSTAEYLDTVRAFSDLGLSPEKEEEWLIISSATLSKRQTPA
ncbi:MAG TPA: MoxR family ATPase [Pyrinomonadaceae bacterium]|nr:MoxR family ATPase [Pyrinomonadaceae bacterium]